MIMSIDPGLTMPDPLTYWLSGNLLKWIEAVYMVPMGYTFFGVILLTLGAVSYIKSQNSLYVAIAWISSGASLWAVLPMEGRPIGFIFIVLGTAAAFWWAWFGRR